MKPEVESSADTNPSHPIIRFKQTCEQIDGDSPVVFEVNEKKDKDKTQTDEFGEGLPPKKKHKDKHHKEKKKKKKNKHKKHHSSSSKHHHSSGEE